jgi:hypothetical protein
MQVAPPNLSVAAARLGFGGSPILGRAAPLPGSVGDGHPARSGLEPRPTPSGDARASGPFVQLAGLVLSAMVARLEP